MINIRRSLAALAILLTLAVGFFAGFASAGQPHMYNALHDLQHARTQLNEAEKDKAGHRVNALNYVNQAIGEVNAGISAGR